MDSAPLTSPTVRRQQASASATCRLSRASAVRVRADDRFKADAGWAGRHLPGPDRAIGGETAETTSAQTSARREHSPDREPKETAARASLTTPAPSKRVW